MTNTLHRQGTLQNLTNDYVIFIHLAKGINDRGSAPKIQEFTRICLKHQPVNIGSVKEGNILKDDMDSQKLISNVEDAAIIAAVFKDLDTLHEVVRN